MRGGAPLGESVLNITTDARGLDKGLAAAKRQVTGWTDDVQKRLNGVGSSIKGGILTGVGLGAGVTGFQMLSNAIAGTISTLGDFAHEAIADEESVNRLTASLEANVAGFDGNIEAIEERIEASQRLGFSDEQLRDSLTVLVGATHDVSRAQETMAAAMDLARFKGIDLRTASEALIKVEGGHFRMLAQLGIKMREGASTAEALAAVQAVTAGQAEAYADTTAGAMAAAQIAFQEAGEEIGRSILPGMTVLAEFARDDLAPAISDVVDELDGLREAGDRIDAADFLGIATRNIGEFIRAVYELGTILPRIGEALTGTDEPVTAMTEAWAQAWLDMGPAANRLLSQGQGQVGTGARNMLMPVYREMTEAQRKAVEEARATPGEIAKALRQGQEEVESGMSELTDLMENSLSDAAKVAHLKGILSSTELAAGLRDERADVRAAAMEVRDDALRELELLESGAYDTAVDAGMTAAAALSSTKTANATAAAAIAKTTRDNLAWDATAAGRAVGNTYAQGLLQALNAVYAAAETLASQASGQLAPWHSPPRFGPLKTIDEDARALGELWATNFTGGIGGGLEVSLGGAIPTIPGRAAEGPGVTNIYNLEVNGQPFGLQNQDDLLQIMRGLAAG